MSALPMTNARVGLQRRTLSHIDVAPPRQPAHAGAALLYASATADACDTVCEVYSGEVEVQVRVPKAR